MEEILLHNYPLWTVKRAISSVMQEVDVDGEFQILHVVYIFTCMSHPIEAEISQQVCALKVLAISVGKGHDSLIYVYDK